MSYSDKHFPTPDTPKKKHAEDLRTLKTQPSELSERRALEVPVDSVAALPGKGERALRMQALKAFASVVLEPSKLKQIATMYMNAAGRNPAVRLHYITALFKLLELEARSQQERNAPVTVNVFTSIRKDGRVITMKPGDKPGEYSREHFPT